MKLQCIRNWQSALFVVLSVLSSTSIYGQDIEHHTLPENAPKNLPFSEAVRVDGTVYLSGQIGIPPGESELVDGGIGAESRQTLENIGAVLRHFGLDFSDIVKCTVMLADISEWPAFNAVYTQYFARPYPARSAFASSGLAFGARVELECTAVGPWRHGQHISQSANHQCLERNSLCSAIPCCPGLECRPSGSHAGVPRCYTEL